MGIKGGQTDFYTIGSDLWALNAITVSLYYHLAEKERLICVAVFLQHQRKVLDPHSWNHFQKFNHHAIKLFEWCAAGDLMAFDKIGN